MFTIDTLPIAGGVKTSRFYGSDEEFQQGIAEMERKMEASRLKAMKSPSNTVVTSAGTNQGLQSSFWAPPTTVQKSQRQSKFTSPLEYTRSPPSSCSLSVIFKLSLRGFQFAAVFDHCLKRQPSSSLSSA